ncbi:MAG: helix-turn-helix domain-containing protein [Xanthomonadaceae bacterium]|jgi:transcriptional regulator with XRE-family HTH domain|nr:helix-turn-helix domain-containing protein [Xanthomonadaceae bacterium]
MATQQASAAIFAENLRRLMEHSKLSQAELGRKAKVAQTMLSGLLSRDEGVKNPTSSTIDKLCGYFKVPPWKMLMPGIAIELLLDHGLETVVEAYAQSSKTGQDTILRISQVEARYEKMNASSTSKTGTSG